MDAEYDLFFALILGFMPAINVEAQVDRVDELFSSFYITCLFTYPPSPLPFLSFFSRMKADKPPVAGSPWGEAY